MSLHSPTSFASFFGLAAMLLLGVASCDEPTDASPPPTYQVFAGGQDNVLLGYDGEEWQLLTTSPGSRELQVLWGKDADTVYALTRTGLIRWDGSGLTEVTEGWSGRTHPGLWGYGDHLWATPNGEIAHWDGTSWSYQQLPGYVRGVWASGPDNVFAVGRHFWRYDGEAWDSVPKPVLPDTLVFTDLLAVWGASPTDVFAVGLGGFFRFDGETLERFETDLYGEDGWLDMVALTGTSASDVYAVENDGTIYHFDGTEWTLMKEFPFRLLGIHARSPTDIYAVGADGSIVHYDGRDWSIMETPTQAWLWTVWAP